MSRLEDLDFKQLHEEARVTVYQMVTLCKAKVLDGTIDPHAILRLGYYMGTVDHIVEQAQRMKQVAAEVLVHLEYMRSKGLLTEEELPMLGRLRTCFEEKGHDGR